MNKALLALLVLGMLCSAATGQTTRPLDPWAATVERFAAATTQPDAHAAAALASDAVTIRAFDSTRNEELARVLERVADAKLVGAYAASHEPTGMASNIAEGIRASSAIPEELKTYMVPPEDELPRANATAAKWLDTELELRDGDRVGVIVLWCPKPGSAGARQAQAADDREWQLTFILLKGEPGRGTGEHRITTIVYGFPLAR